jgi:hypothetical protein
VVQIIELKRFGGAPHYIQFAPLKKVEISLTPTNFMMLVQHLLTSIKFMMFLTLRENLK